MHGVHDRGPFHDGRVIDLSYAGAVALGYQNQGTARVKIEVVGTSGPNAALAASPDAKPVAEQWYVQLGAFSDQSRAQALTDQVNRETRYKAFIDHAGLYRVRTGPFQRKQAEKIARRLARNGVGPPVLVRQ